jgi:hypothetical protein
MRDRARVALQHARLLQHLDDALLRLLRREPGDLGVCSLTIGDAIQSGVPAANRPSRPISARVGSWSSRHHVTSVVSPNVQIIATPVPFSGRERMREHRAPRRRTAA